MRFSQDRALKVGVSLLIIYHLLCIVILPNYNSLLGRSVGDYLTAYANTLNFNTTWMFFSPNPGGQRFIEFQISKGKDPDEISYWPPKSRAGILWDNYNRRMYHSMLTTLSDSRVRGYFVPFLCRTHPYAKHVTIQTLTDSTPAIENAQLDERKFSELNETLYVPLTEFECEDFVGAGASHD